MTELREMAELLVIMGVSGCGKSTIASQLCELTGWTMIEGDSLHPAVNRQKMAAGEPLTNDDRMPWLDAIAGLVNECSDDPVVLACSSLNETIRNRLTKGVERPCRWIFLEVPEEVLKLRMEGRKGHFMPSSLLQSQLAALDPPVDAVKIDGTCSSMAVCEAILAALDERIE